MATSLIANTILRYHPEWAPPHDNGRRWIPCKCPFHQEERASASISYQHNAFTCHACGVKGDPIKIIRLQEGVGYATAERIAAEVSARSDTPLPELATRKPSRRVFGETRTQNEQPRNPDGDRPIPHRVCRRTFGGT